MNEPFESDSFYHIYNQANGNEYLFREKKNYPFFLIKFKKYISPVAETYCWCLLKNHFHVMLRIKAETEIAEIMGEETFQKFQTFGKLIGRQFGRLFSSYTQSYNKVYNRKGSLFQPNLKRKEVADEIYFTQLILYIHNNAVKHGFTNSPMNWPHSSVHQFLNPKLSSNNLLKNITRQKVISWFGGEKEFRLAHQDIPEQRSLFE